MVLRPNESCGIEALRRVPSLTEQSLLDRFWSATELPHLIFLAACIPNATPCAEAAQLTAVSVTVLCLII